MMKYKQMLVKRVEITKANGGTRLLVIPTVQDRFIQQAIFQELNYSYDENFLEHSFGLRTRRGARDAIKKAENYIDGGTDGVWIQTQINSLIKLITINLCIKLSKDIKDNIVPR